jgi:hypothetical protein
MSRSIYLCSFLSIFSGFCLAGPVYQKGMSYTPWSWSTLDHVGSTKSISNMKEVGIEWAALTVFWFQDDRNSTLIESDRNLYSASTGSVENAIADMKSVGIKVMLKPHIDLRSGEWRARIQPSEEWFTAYEDYIVNWAVFAEDHDVDMLCIGCEFVDAVKLSKWDQHWRDIIAEIRNVYNGPLTYASNHGNEQNVRWWDALDYIGIDAYYPLTQKNDCTFEELVTAWNNQATKIEAWHNRRWPDKPIIFTEIGYRSFDGANSQPWEYSTHDSEKIDLQEQYDCYNAALTVLTEREWFYGFYWWSWETSPNAGGEDNDGFTVQNKPSQDLLEDWYLNRLVGERFDSAGISFFERY